MGRWMDGWADGWIDGWMDGHTVMDAGFVEVKERGRADADDLPFTCALLELGLRGFAFLCLSRAYKANNWSIQLIY